MTRGPKSLVSSAMLTKDTQQELLIKAGAEAGWLMFLMISGVLSGIVNGQTGVFSSTTNYTSPQIVRTGFDGADQEGFVSSGGFQPGGHLTTDGNHIYWTNPVAIKRTHLQTRVTETVATYPSGSFDPQGITTDGHHLYIASVRNPISEYGLNGQWIRAVGASTRYITGLVTDGIFIFWSDEEEGLFRMKLDGSEREQIGTETSIMGMNGDSTHLYWANDRDRLIRRCGLDGSNPETLVNLAEVFGTTLPNGDRVNYLASGIVVTLTHVYWEILGTYRGIYRCELDGANPVRLTVNGYTGGASLTAYPNALFPEPMQPVRPTLRHDADALTVTLEWPAIADRRYLLLKSTDLERFSQAGGLMNCTTTEGLETLSSPEASAFFIVRKLPGTVSP